MEQWTKDRLCMRALELRDCMFECAYEYPDIMEVLIGAFDMWLPTQCQ
jgi:hypothetical protein